MPRGVHARHTSLLVAMGAGVTFFGETRDRLTLPGAGHGALLARTAWPLADAVRALISAGACAIRGVRGVASRTPPPRVPCRVARMNLSDNARGALFMVGAMAAFTINDAFLKGVSGSLPLEQAVFLRGLGTSALLFLMVRGARLRLPPLARDRWLLGLRSLAEVGAVWLFLTALFNMPFANAQALLQALPLAVTLASALFLAEKVGPRRWLAIAAGFGGVVLMIRPGAEGFTVYSVYVVGAVFLVAARDIILRKMSRDVPTSMIAFAGALGQMLFFGAFSLGRDWAPVDAGMLVYLAGSTVFVVAAHFLTVSAVRTGEIGAVAPFRYSSLVVALIIGLLVWGEWPDALTLAGAAVVIASGLVTLARQRKQRFTAPRPDAPIR